MRTRFGSASHVVGRSGVRGGDMPLHPSLHSAEARRLQAEAMAEAVHWLWTNARRRGARLAQLVRRSILEPLARGHRRRIAISQLRAMDDRLLADIGVARGEIELVVDGILSRHRDGRRIEQHPAAEDYRPELPLAA